MKIIEKESFIAVGLKVEANWQDLHTKMPEAWHIFKQRIQEISGRKSNEMMDISLNKEGQTYTQLVAVEVEGPAVVADDMVAVTIPQQKYIRYVHRGDLPSIASSFGKMYEWAKEQNIKAGEFKLDIGYRADGSEKEHELFVKVLSSI